MRSSFSCQDLSGLFHNSSCFFVGGSNAVFTRSSVKRFRGRFSLGTASYPEITPDTTNLHLIDFFRPSPLTLTPTKSSGSKKGRHRGRLTISRSSLIVKATCSGPRRPTMYTLLMRLLTSSSSAASVISVFRRTSTGVSSILAGMKICESFLTSVYSTDKYSLTWPRPGQHFRDQRRPLFRGQD